MARPRVSARINSMNMSNEERQRRIEAEDKLRGKSDCITAPGFLTDTQKTIFDNTVELMKGAEILSNRDVYILTIYSIAVDRITTIEQMINENSDLINNKGLLTAKRKYTDDYFRCMTELCLSPQSRAKMESLNTKAKEEEEDILLQILASNSK